VGTCGRRRSVGERGQLILPPQGGLLVSCSRDESRAPALPSREGPAGASSSSGQPAQGSSATRRQQQRSKTDNGSGFFT
jgi:hypothetical protein